MLAFRDIQRFPGYSVCLEYSLDALEDGGVGAALLTRLIHDYADFYGYDDSAAGLGRMAFYKCR